jgi:hypothetical protein
MIVKNYFWNGKDDDYFHRGEAYINPKTISFVIQEMKKPFYKVIGNGTSVIIDKNTYEALKKKLED